MAAELRFRAMGSDAHIVVVDANIDMVNQAKARVDELERRWSRFLDDSEISELNRRAGEFVTVSSDTVALVERSVEAWSLSAGAFDPTVLGAVIRAGYDRSFELLGPSPPAGDSTLGLGVTGIMVREQAVRLPSGTGLDPGGIGKGLAADIVCTELMAAGAGGACVNLGGDVRVAGTGPDGGAWTVAIEHPWVDQPFALIGVKDGAVATSTTLRRSWRTDGQARHHLIDPQTGMPSDTDLTLATVVAAQAWVAEVLAKSVLLAGTDRAFNVVGATRAQALAVDNSFRVHSTSGLAAYLGTAVLPAQLVDVAASY
jgi:FAD:protein FMN transferase